MLRVGLNGAGRIGRALLRILRDDPQVSIVALNDVADPTLLAHLLRHDSIHGPFPGPVDATPGTLRAGERTLLFTHEPDPARIPWERAQVDVVVEATGAFSHGSAARAHLHGTVGRVVISAVADEVDAAIVLGVQDGRVDPSVRVVSTGSCTTHAAALPLALLDRWYGVEAAEAGTVHCTTGSQPTMDLPHHDRRRARSALLSMIPTTTSAARGIVAVLPQLAGRLTCHAIRVPVATVSLVDVVAQTRRPVDDPERLAELFEAEALGALAGILGATREELVSIDFKGDSRSSIIDIPMIARPGQHLVRVIAWYDNEWGYASRLADLLRRWAAAPAPTGGSKS